MCGEDLWVDGCVSVPVEVKVGRGVREGVDAYVLFVAIEGEGEVDEDPIVRAQMDHCKVYASPEVCPVHSTPPLLLSILTSTITNTPHTPPLNLQYTPIRTHAPYASFLLILTPHLCFIYGAIFTDRAIYQLLLQPISIGPDHPCRDEDAGVNEAYWSVGVKKLARVFRVLEKCVDDLRGYYKGLCQDDELPTMFPVSLGS